MSDEPEVTQDSDDTGIYNDHSVDNSVHHAVNLWPLVLVAAIVVSFVSAVIFLPDAKHREQSVPNGKAYVAVGNIVDCLPMAQWGNGPYRSFIRTPKDEFFAVYWRRDFQPPLFGAATGELKYHQCGIQDGTVVHCFDSFAVNSQRVKILDLSPEMPKKQ